MTTEAPIVHTRSGDVRGVWRTQTSAAFLGIPFAEPPVGELRFRAPVPRRPWDGVLDATEPGPTPQRRPFGEVTAIPEPSIPGEDTLRVNVFTPRPGDTAAGLPVYVWIHGGGFFAGSPASPWYDGRAFNRDGVVTVTVSYRLGFDGFGWLPDAPANRGVLDWLCALEWVRDTITAFGGDPDRVTIGGQSAGGGAVLTLLGMPTAQRLFARAICESGVPGDVLPGTAERTTRRLAEILGVQATRAGFTACTEDQILDAQQQVTNLDEMADKPVDLLRGMVRRQQGVIAFGPVVDGDLVPVPVTQALAHGAGADKGLLVGTTANEMNAAAANVPKAVRFVPASGLLALAGLPRGLIRQYLRARAGLSTSEVLGQLVTDLIMRAPLTEYCAAHQGDTWVYDFRWPSPAAGGLAPHCLELPFAWDCLDAERVVVNTGPNPPQAVADAMHGAWVRFITEGDPGWAPYRAPDHQGQVFDTVSRAEPDVYRAERLLATR